MSVRRVRTEPPKKRRENLVVGLDFAPFLGNGEEVSSVGAVNVSPTGGAPLGGSHLSSGGTAIVGGNVVEVLTQDGAEPQDVTVATSSDELVFSAAHGWALTAEIQLIGKRLPRAYLWDEQAERLVDRRVTEADRFYVLVGADSQRMQIAETVDGAAIDFTEAEGGQMFAAINYVLSVEVATGSTPPQQLDGEVVVQLRA